MPKQRHPRRSGEVVVITSINVSANEEGTAYIAQIANLGLTAHGTSPARAEQLVVRMFVHLIAQYRADGVLKKRLDHSPASWWWREDYVPGPPVLEARSWREQDNLDNIPLAA